jgi:hypothetical protein
MNLRSLAWCVFVVTLCVTTFRAHAQEVQIVHEPPSEVPHAWTETVALAAAGAVSAFVLHESGHVLTNLALGNVPHFEGTKTLGFIPFFVINPGVHCQMDRCFKRNGQRLPFDRNGSFLIATAGFEVQHITDEILLSLNPQLAEQYAPFQQGMLAFNIFLSALYAGGALTGLENPHGDLKTAAQRLGANERLCAVALLIPAALDAYRFFYPSATWAIWASRGTKASMIGLTLLF